MRHLYYISFVAQTLNGRDYGDLNIRLDGLTAKDLDEVRGTLRHHHPHFVGPVVFLHIAKLDEVPA